MAKAKTKAIAKRKPSRVKRAVPSKHPNAKKYGKAAARLYAAGFVFEAIDVLVAVMRDVTRSGHCRAAAAEKLFRMGYGQLDVQPGERLPGMTEGEAASGAQLSDEEKLLMYEAAVSVMRRRLGGREVIDVEAG